jgi:hypothetical protein
MTRALIGVVIALSTACSATRAQDASTSAASLHPGPCVAVLDTGPDGSPDQVRRFTYDEAGRLARQDVSIDGGSAPDSWTIYGYDSAGRLVTEQRFWRGEPDVTTTYGLGAEGRPERAEVVNDAIGTTETLVVYHHDAQGNLIREEWSYVDEEDGDDGEVDEVRVHAYNAAGQRITSERLDGAGSMLEYRTLTYNSGGNVVREDLGPQPGSVYATIEYSFDCWR